MEDPSPPIHRLHRDVLWHIVEMNANMFTYEGAFQTTRLTSHVCRSWRELMLNTPSLWAKLFDLNCLYQPANEWRRELMSRSGTKSLLWIKGRRYVFMKGSTDLVEFFFDLLRDHWTRIQRLVVQFDVKPMVPTCWAPLYRPAPHLEEFSLPFWNSMFAGAQSELPTTPLFANEAPMLREFSSQWYMVDRKAPWLRQLRKMELSVVETPHEALEILAEAPNLEYLEIADIDYDGYLVFPLRVVSFPKLKHLLFCRVDAQKSAIMLDHLQLPPQCTLDYATHRIWDDGALSEEKMRPVALTLSKFARRFFQSRAPKHISLEYLGASFTFTDRTGSSGCWLSFTTSFNSVFPLHTAVVLMRGLTIPVLSMVTALELLINNPIDSSFLSFLECMPLLEIMNTSTESMHYLIDAHNQYRTTAGTPKILVPSIKVLKLSYFDADGLRGVVFEFIMLRIRDGCPLAVLDMSAHSPPIWPSMVFLEEADGLKVRWWMAATQGVLEYVCGSGHPEELPSSPVEPAITHTCAMA